MSQLTDLAQKIRPSLALLAGEAEALRLDDAIGRLLREHADGVDVDGRLLDLFSSVPAVERFVDEALGRSTPPQPTKGSYDPLAGDRMGAAPQRYECPYGDHAVWHRVSLCDEVPLCAEHRVRLELVAAR
ncbi:hypothetical protein [Actinoplanes sp. NPDC049802]|uniref:hypothetical protein n=1 Tax=Actinoplanes sp. NPDC049802 TaxID=3154742 RepID=UPI0033FD55A1